MVGALRPGLLDENDFSRESLFTGLRHDYGLTLAAQTRPFAPVSPTMRNPISGAAAMILIH
jgi:hypothetical protein